MIVVKTHKPCFRAPLVTIIGPKRRQRLSAAMAAQAAGQEASGLTLDQDASGPGLHDWLKERLHPGPQLSYKGERRSAR